MKDETPDSKEADGALAFDDCLRLLVNTPPKPKKAEEAKTPPDEPEG